MTYQWLGLTEMLPIVEFHDIRAEKGSANRYLELVEGPLAAPFAGAGGAMLGQFRVENHPDRVMVLRGFPSMAARRQALQMYLKSGEWRAHRATLSALERDNGVILARTLTTGTAPQLRAGDSCTAIVSEVRFAEQLGDYHLGLRRWLREAGIEPLAAFATLESANDVPAVPVIRNRTHHIALIPRGGVPAVPADLRAMLRFSPEILGLSRVPALAW
jgi:hypothetical protein